MNKKNKKIMGKTEPRIFTPPLRKLTEKTTLGYACIEYAETVLKKKLYPWQKWALIHMLEIVGSLDSKWHFRFHTVIILVSRQNGKTVLSEVIASFFLNVLQVKSILGASLNLDKALETLNATIEDQETIPELKREITRISRVNGANKLILKGNRIYKIAAKNRGMGRGDSNDLIIIDELREHRNWEAWSAAAASTNAKPNALIVCFSNAGDPDSIVLRQVRSQAIAEIENDASKKQDFGGIDTDSLGLFEWSAEDGCQTDDVEQLAQANPALGYGQFTMRALISDRLTFPENKFRSECMCQTVDTLLPEPFTKGSWDELLDPTSIIKDGADLYYGIDMSADRRTVSIAVCGQREDGNYHIEVITKRNGTQWAIDWFRERTAKGQTMKLAFQGRGAPICGLAEEICTLNGVQRFAIEGQNLSDGWARFYDGICSSQAEGAVKIYHIEQPILDHCAKIMQLKNFGNGISLPDRVKSPDDISALFACIMAFSAASQIQFTKSTKRIYESVYNEDYTLAFV